MKLMEYSVKKDEIKIEDLADTVAMLTVTVQTMNDVLLVLANKLDINADIPHWKTKEDIEKSVGPKIQKCVELIKDTYGHGETDKS